MVFVEDAFYCNECITITCMWVCECAQLKLMLYLLWYLGLIHWCKNSSKNVHIKLILMSNTGYFLCKEAMALKYACSKLPLPNQDMWRVTVAM